MLVGDWSWQKIKQIMERGRGWKTLTKVGSDFDK